MSIIHNPPVQEQFTPDLIGEVVAKVGEKIPVFYDYGHYSVVTQNLDEKDKNIFDKSKYPLIWLVMDFKEQENAELKGYTLLDLQFIIATDTQAVYTMQERRDHSFLPVLLPLYRELIYQFSISRVFKTSYEMKPVKTLRPYWGIQSGLGNGEANLFNDYIDAIQVEKFKINIRGTVC